MFSSQLYQSATKLPSLSKLSPFYKRSCACSVGYLQRKFYGTPATSSVESSDAFTQKAVGDVLVVTYNMVDSKVNVVTDTTVAIGTKIFAAFEKNDQFKSAVFISGKPGNFIAGADINALKACSTVEAATLFSEECNEGMNFLESCKKPVVAAINGVCLGGGLELAMACHYRVALDTTKTSFGLPEIMLGLLPGGGGTQRLAPLVGLPDALDLMLTGKTIKASKAKKLGLVDQLVEELGPGTDSSDENSLKHLEKVAIQIAKDLAGGKLKVNREKPWNSLAGFQHNAPLKIKPLRDFVLKKARDTVMKKTMGLYPAPLEIIKAVKSGLEGGKASGQDAETKGFGNLVRSDVAESLIGLFKSQTECKKNSYGLPDNRAQRIGILGAGLMGAGISEVSIQKAQHNITLKDATLEGLSRGVDQVYGNLNKRTKRRQMTTFERDVIFSRMHSQTDYSGFDKLDMVIEAVFEDINIKHKVLKEVEAVTPDHCIFASNTSALPIKDIAAASSRPENVIGMHYFSPVDKMPLLEIITTEQTSKEAISSAVDVGLKQGKTVIVVKDGPGFYTTRCLIPASQEIFCLLEEGVTPQDIDKRSLEFGFPVGSVTLLDEVGIDVAAHIITFSKKVFADRMGNHDDSLIQEMVRNGFLGRKSKKGFFEYSGKRRPNEGAMKLIEKYQKPPSVGIGKDELAMRIISRMVNEAVLCLEEGILKSPSDGDIGAVFGFGFPAPHGGPFRFVDRYGAHKLVKLMEKFQLRIGEPQFQPCQLLLDHAKDTSLKFHTV